MSAQGKAVGASSFTRKRTLQLGSRGLAVLLACVALSAGSAAAGPVTYTIPVTAQGSNTILDANGGSLYIPQLPGTSGNLGDPLGGGLRVGLDRDSVTLSKGQISEGWVSFVLTFTIGYQPTAVESVISGILEITLQDLDFKPVDSVGRNFRETMELTFLQDATDAPGAVDLLIDSSNYGSFGDFAVGDTVKQTNDRRTTYSMDLATHLNVTPADFADMKTDLEFGILMTVRSRTERTASGGRKYNNTLEKLNEDIAGLIVFGPEPVSAALLAVGALGLIRRRRRA